MTPTSVVWHLRALDDLEDLRRHIAQDDPAAANAVRDRIRELINILPTYPHIGRPGRVAGVRELVVTGTPYIVPYMLAPSDRIEILAVIHGAMQWPKDFA